MGIALLVGAIACEVFATTMMKLSLGFTVLPASIACVVGYIACFGLLSRALLHIDLSVSYALWAGLGIVATTLIAVFAFGDRLTGVGVVAIGLIVVGVVLLNLYGTAH